MDEKQVKLQVNNLRISFRTDAGKVQAVRDISFKLYKGETLAIVGESGSGKSVTNRAVMGILAGNAIKEGGEILYDGQDLMKISEEEFHAVRGDKIAMIFQDPLSSLNPIMRIGKQMTEAMLIKGKVNQKNCRKDFNTLLALLNASMNGARGAEYADENKKKCSDFDKFEYKHIALEQDYNRASEAATDALSDIEDILFRIEKKSYKDVLRDTNEALKRAEHSFNKYVVYARADELRALIAEGKKLVKLPITEKTRNFMRQLFNRGEDTYEKADYTKIAETLEKVQGILAEAVAAEKPNFFSMGYYITFSGQPLPEMEISKLNEYLHEYLGEHFMYEFIELVANALKYSHDRSTEYKKEAVALLNDAAAFFKGDFSEKAAKEKCKQLSAAVEKAIDRLEIVKDNTAYTFSSSLHSAVETYFGAIIRNKKEEARYRKQKAKYDRKAASGKTPDYEVAEMNLVDLDSAKGDIEAIVLRVKEDFENRIAQTDIDYNARANAVIDYLKEKASGVVFKITRSMAKLRALKLMEEVGIPEARRRFRQYPFEFSGGMRQRIVIAIALAANPDILICDEPTTALDVTIQSQILELINRIKEERNLSVIFITHNLGVVANMADRVAVMYAGKIVEIGTANDIFYSPAHPYTWALLSSMPDLDTKEKLEAIPGTPPNMVYPPKGDAFADRNKYALKIDFEEQPPMFKISDTHYAATWLLHPDAPKLDPPKSVTDRIARMRSKEGHNDE